MDYKEMFVSLVAFCQREGILSSGSAVCEEIAEICGIDEEAAAEAIE